MYVSSRYTTEHNVITRIIYVAKLTNNRKPSIYDRVSIIINHPVGVVSC